MGGREKRERDRKRKREREREREFTHAPVMIGRRKAAVFPLPV